jgi:hypothetical protein
MNGRRFPPGMGPALGLTFSLMLLVAGGVADRGLLFPVAVLAGSGGALAVLYALFPHGPHFALGAANGLAMYICLYVVLGRAGFPGAQEWARLVGFLLPVFGFVLACWWRRPELGMAAEGEETPDLDHLPRFARWLLTTGVVGLVALALPIGRLDAVGQSFSLIGAMLLIAAISATAVGDVVRLLVDVAYIFESVARRVAHLAVPIAAYSSLYALITVIFGCAYRIADGVSNGPLFAGTAGPIRLGFPDAMHFSVVTLSSVGYGDLLPVDDGIRVLASIEMLLSQLLLLFGFAEIMRGRLGGRGGRGGDATPG